MPFARFITSTVKDAFRSSNANAFGPILRDLKIVVVDVYSEDRSVVSNMLFCDSEATFQRLSDENQELLAAFNLERSAHIEAGAKLDYESGEYDNYINAFLHAKDLAEAKVVTISGR